MTTFDYREVPPGTYLCTVAEVRVGRTTAGDERWSLRLLVADGPHAGLHAAWDNLVFSPRGYARARRVLRTLGLPGKERILPADLEGRRAMVEVREATYVNQSGEGYIARNEVPYDGYREAP